MSKKPNASWPLWVTFRRNQDYGAQGVVSHAVARVVLLCVSNAPLLLDGQLHLHIGYMRKLHTHEREREREEKRVLCAVRF